MFACFGLKGFFLGQYSVSAVPGLQSAVLSKKNNVLKQTMQSSSKVSRLHLEMSGQQKK